MAQSGRLLNHDGRADEIASMIRSGVYDDAKRLMLECGVHVMDGYGRTPLIHAILKNDSDLCGWLLRKGANVNHQDKSGYTALHVAALNRAVDVARLLLSTGADPNLQDIHGNSPLWTAVLNTKGTAEGHAIVAMLLKAGANPDLVNVAGRTPRIMFETIYKRDITL